MDATALPSGTVYPILRRLEAEGCVRSRWEKEGEARKEQRPPRRYYELTSHGRAIAQDAASKYRAVHQITPVAAKAGRP
jgi:DNA-binding PadR family transcriptional regulator